MADSDKDILITPNKNMGDTPAIVFTGKDGNPLTLYVLDTGSLSIEGSTGQLFSVSDDFSGSIFSVNNISGLPSLEVFDDGEVRLAEFSGNVGVGISEPQNKLVVSGSIHAVTSVTASTFLGDLLGTSSWSDNVTTSSLTQTIYLSVAGDNINYPVVFSSTTDQVARVDGDLFYNPSTNTLTATNFSGNLVGGIATATETTEGQVEFATQAEVDLGQTAGGNNQVMRAGENRTTITGTNTLHIGQKLPATRADDTIVIGNSLTTDSTYADAKKSVVIGHESTGSQPTSVVIGWNAKSLSGYYEPNKSVVIGYKATATSYADNAVAIGGDVTVTGYSGPVGINCTVNGVGSIGIGGLGSVTGDYSIGVGSTVSAHSTIGIGASLTGYASVSIGNLSSTNTAGVSIGRYARGRIGAISIGAYVGRYTVNGVNSVSIGRGSHSGYYGVAGVNSISIGAYIGKTNNSNTSVNAIAIGYKALSQSSASIAIGSYANVPRTGSIGIGQNVEIIHDNTIVIGSQNNMVAGGYGDNIVIGSKHTIGATYSTEQIAIGKNNNIDGYAASPRVSIGSNNTITGGYGTSVAIGSSCSAFGDGIGSLSIGSQATGTGAGSITIGVDTTTGTSQGSIAIGTYTTGDGTNAIGIGYNSDAGGTGAIAIGKNCDSLSSKTIVIGDDSVAPANSGYHIVIGSGNTAPSLNNSSILIGKNITTGTSTGGQSNQIAIGSDTHTTGEACIAIGFEASASGAQSTSIGYKVINRVPAVTEVGNWDDNGRRGSLRIHNTRMSSFTLQDYGIEYTDGGSTYGLEGNNTLMRDGYAIRRHDGFLYIDHNTGSGTILSTDLSSDKFGISLDGGGGFIATGSFADTVIPWDCTIDQYVMFADVTGTCVVDVRQSNYATYPTFTSITGSTGAQILASNKSQDTTLSGWTTTLSKGDIVRFNVVSSSLHTKCNLTFLVNK